MKYALAFLAYAIDGRKVKAVAISCLIFALSVLVGCRAQHAIDQERMESERMRLLSVQDQLIAAKKEEIEAVKQQAEAGIYASQYLPQRYMEDAYWLAIWLGDLQELYPGISVEARGLACWGVFCRMESESYPDRAQHVLQQTGQFNEYSDAGKPTEENVTIASNQLSRWANGDIRPCGEGAVYISVSADGVVLRDTFEETRQTNYWRA